TIREYGFVTNQLNLWFMIGSALPMAVIYSLCRPGRSAGADVRAFWITLYGVGIPLGIAVVGSPEDWGLGHICLQPLTLLAIAFATARFRTWPNWLKAAAISGGIVDFGLGGFLQFRDQNL